MVTKKEAIKKDLNKKEVREELHSEKKYNRGRSTAEKRASYGRYFENKRAAIELEERNLQHLVLYPASDIDTNKETKFYTMGGNSAIIYVHEIAPRLKRKATLRRDLDACKEDDKFRAGICSIADLPGLEERLKAIGIERVPYGGELDLIFFKLAREYSKDEIKNMLKLERERIETLNNLLFAKIVFPDVHRRILDLERIIPNKVKKMEKSYREVIGERMITVLVRLAGNYARMTHGDLKPEAAMPEMILECDTLAALISMMNELKVWEVDGCLRTGEIVTELRQLLINYSGKEPEA